MKLKKQEESKAGFKPLVDALDNRTPDQVGETLLHEGYSVSAGIKGSKLSGG
jgi:hypothetical protein